MKRQELLDTEEKIRKALTKYGTLEGKIGPEVAKLVIIEEYEKSPDYRLGRGNTQREYAFALRAPDDGGRVDKADLEAVKKAMNIMFNACGVGPDPRSFTGDTEPTPFGKDKTPVVASYPIMGINKLEDVDKQIDGYYGALKKEYNRLTQPDERAFTDNLVRAISGKPIKYCSQSSRTDEETDIRYERLTISADDAKQIASDIVNQMTASGFSATLEGTDERPVIEVPVDYKTSVGVF